MALFKRYNSTTQQWEVIGGGGGSIELADLATIGGVQALKASTLVTNLCADSSFRTWAAAQTPPIDTTSARTWDRDFNTVLEVYTKYTQDVNGVVELWGSNLLDDVSNTNQLYPLSSITTPTTENFGVIKATGIYEMSSLLCATPDFQAWAAAQTPPIDTTSARTWDRSITTALPILRDYHEHIGTFENHSLNLFDDIDKTYQLFPLTGKGVSPATKGTLGGIKAVNATEFVSDLCGDRDFQDWAAAQTPPIDTTSARTWDSDFPTIVNVYSRFMESGGRVAAVWGTNIFDNVDNTQQVFPISSIGVATDQTAGVVKGSAPYNSTFTAPVAVDTFGRAYCRNTELVPQYIRTSVGQQRTFDFAEGVQTCFFVEFIQSATVMPILLNVNNSFVNYIEFYNPTSDDVDIALNGVNYKGIGQIDVHKPQVISVPSGRLVEVSVLANAFGINNRAIITASEPLTIN